MNKELEFIRKAVIMACHPKCTSYEKAVEKEKENHREELCKILDDTLLCSRVWEAWEVGTMSQDDFCLAVEAEDFFEETLETFSQPVTLARVLIALKDKGRFGFSENGWIKETLPKNKTYSEGRFPICKWDLTKDLDKQSPGTILSIAKLLGYETK